MKQSALAVHPDGWAKSTGRFPLSELTPSPRYEEIVRAFDGHGERAETPAEVEPALQRGLAAVREGRQAVAQRRVPAERVSVSPCRCSRRSSS